MRRQLERKLTGMVFGLRAAILAIERDWRQVHAIEHRRNAGRRRAALMTISFQERCSCEVNSLVCCNEKGFRVLRTAVVIHIVSSSSIDPRP